MILSEQENEVDAITQINKSIELNPKFVDAYLYLTYIYDKSDDIQKGIEILEGAIKILPM